jgi:cysteinyl-tRNA synthetase
MKMTDLVGFKFEVKELNEEEIGLYQQWENYKAQKDFENADVVRQALIAKGVL